MASLDSQTNLSRARSLFTEGQFARALGFYEAAATQSSVAIIWYEYGTTAAKLRRFDLAARAWGHALRLEPRNAELIGMIGHQYQTIRRPDDARACFQQAAEAEPRAVNPRISLAVLSEKSNRLAEAREAVEGCLAIDPRDEQARYFTAVLDRREGNLEGAERRLRDLIASEPRHPYVRYAARYELAQVMDRTQRYDQAMRWLAEAKEIVRQLTDTSILLRAYDKTAEAARAFTAAQPKDILQTWSKYFPERRRSAIPPLVFLGGHPRSGTTLLEQILDAHPSVAAMDEPEALVEVVQPEFHKTAEHSSPRLNVLRRLYLEAVQPEIHGPLEGRTLIDKNPSPTARLPTWLRVFPELRVIIALRDPCDVVLSCYFQNIPLNSTNVNFLTLERTARHYNDLMGIWRMVREWPGFAWLETRYEDVVADLPREGRRVTEFLGLAWDQRQARFYEQTAARQLYSPTYGDVTRPVYRHAMERWRAYEEYLVPVLPALEPLRHAFGYPAKIG